MFLKANIIIISLLFYSCTYDKVNPSSSSISCKDSIYNSYSLSVTPVIREHCYSCHSTSVTQGAGGLDLENYSSFKEYLKIDYRGDTIFGSMLYHSILKAPGTQSMPPDGRLSDCEIKKIKKWIDLGAPNN